MKQYLDAVREVLEKGTRKESRTGVDTLSTFGVYYEIDLAKGFPLLTTKKINWKHIVLETLWFLSGDTSIKFLQDRKIKFWDPWADDDGKVPSAYGNFWRQFPVHDETEDDGGTTIVEFNDQIRWVLSELKRNPMSRRLVVSAWAPGNAQASKLPPCHALFVLNVQNVVVWETCEECGGTGYRGMPCGSCKAAGRLHTTEQRLCLHLTQRSCDIGLGVPYNIAGYAFLLELFARFAGMKAGIFAHTLIDAHAYTCKPDGSMAEYDHVPMLKKQLRRDPRPLPRLEIGDGIQSLNDVERLIRNNASTEAIMDQFQIHDYISHQPIKFKVAV